ncbi:MAG: DUF4215 domain-containing protein [Candidatus Dadabacteria bacterium]|nr:MAG: DUF4215 domain-containing protein [Candidatus Dadabacteria bacterium]
MRVVNWFKIKGILFGLLFFLFASAGWCEKITEKNQCYFHPLLRKSLKRVQVLSKPRRKGRKKSFVLACKINPELSKGEIGKIINRNGSLSFYSLGQKGVKRFIRSLAKKEGHKRTKTRKQLRKAIKKCKQKTLETVNFLGECREPPVVSPPSTPPHPVCGNGIKEEGEECDDGNVLSEDGCSSTCKNEPQEPVCGNGILEAREECDDGNTVSGDGCSSVCENEISPPPTPPRQVCGNGIVEGSEQCDDGNTVSGDGCSSSCQNESPPPPPPPTPPSQVCGNGIVEGSEQCDDGNTVSGDGCSSTCRNEFSPPPTPTPSSTPTPPSAVCGNNIVEDGEQCDDGNTLSGDGCSSTCQDETPQGPICGNGVIEEGEACECGDDGVCGNNDDNVGGASCSQSGGISGTVVCSQDCTSLSNINCVYPGNTIYVDATLTQDCISDNYSVSQRDCSGSDGNAYNTIQEAVTNAITGDTIIIRPGTYAPFQIRGNRNATGLPGQPITIQAESWYPGIAHDRALDVIIEAQGQDSGVKVIEGEQYIIIRGIMVQNSRNKNIIIANSSFITLEDFETKNASADGLSVSSSQGATTNVVINRCLVHNNGNSGAQFRNSPDPGTVNVLVKDCDSYHNGSLNPENAEGFEDFGSSTRNVYFKGLIAMGNISSNFAAVDPINWTVDNCIGWGTTRSGPLGSADGRGIIAGLHDRGSGTIVRKTVSFDNPLVGFMVTNSPQTSGYNVSIFDNGFQRPGENPTDKPSGVAVDGEDGIYRNVLAFDNAFDYNWNPDSAAKDFRIGSVTNLDADYNYVKDGQYLSFQGSHSLSEQDPTRRSQQDNGYLVANKQLARQLAAAYETASVNGTATWAMRQQFLQQIADALRPAPGSPLIDAGGFLVHTAASVSNSNVVPVDRDPTRFFRVGISEINLEGDTIQIDDGDNNPQTKIIAKIVSMTSNTITLDRPVTVQAGAGIALPYEGNAPDIGAYEYIP